MFIWRKKLNTILRNNSQVITTELGPIEYAIHGHGPIIIGMHGAPGGYDQIICLADNLAKKGFEVIGWSRPGYLRTPLSVGKDFSKQADALALLMDHLLIDKASILAIAAGGPPAMYFASKYPDRVNCLIMEAAITKNHEYNFINKHRKMFSFLLNDVTFWIYYWILHIFPKKALKAFLRLEGNLSNDDLERLALDIVKNPEKLEFFDKLFQSFTPISRRKVGFWNDILQLKTLSEFSYEKITCPTLIIHGSADKDVPLEHAEDLARKLKHCELEKIEKGTHLLNFSGGYFKAEEKMIFYLRKYGKL